MQYFLININPIIDKKYKESANLAAIQNTIFSFQYGILVIPYYK